MRAGRDTAASAKVNGTPVLSTGRRPAAAPGRPWRRHFDGRTRTEIGRIPRANHSRSLCAIAGSALAQGPPERTTQRHYRARMFRRVRLSESVRAEAGRRVAWHSGANRSRLVAKGASDPSSRCPGLNSHLQLAPSPSGAIYPFEPPHLSNARYAPSETAGHVLAESHHERHSCLIFPDSGHQSERDRPYESSERD